MLMDVVGRSANEGNLFKPGRPQHSGIEACTESKSSAYETEEEETMHKAQARLAASVADKNGEIDGLVEFLPRFSCRPSFKT